MPVLGAIFFIEHFDCYKSFFTWLMAFISMFRYAIGNKERLNMFSHQLSPNHDDSAFTLVQSGRKLAWGIDWPLFAAYRHSCDFFFPVLVNFEKLCFWTFFLNKSYELVLRSRKQVCLPPPRKKESLAFTWNNYSIRFSIGYSCSFNWWVFSLPVVASLKHPRTPPTNPSMDYPSGESDHVAKRTRSLGISDEVVDSPDFSIIQSAIFTFSTVFTYC